MASCKHVNAYRSRQPERAKYYRLQRALLALWRKDSRLEDRLKQADQTPLVCLSCAFSSSTCAHHKHQHYAQAKNGHELAVDLQHDQLYCGACSAYVQDAAFENAVKAARALACAGVDEHGSKASAASRECTESVQAMPVLLKRKRHQSGCEQQPVKKAKQEKLRAPVEAVQTGTDFAEGLRGLNNLGNTCFMNSILQVFVHVPLLQAYFLGGGHMHKLCPRLTEHDKPGKCLSCELDHVFSEAYSGQRLPFSPVKFLDTWWRSAEGSLAGYQQQDAHEFYLSLLDGLCQPTERSTTPSLSGSLSPAPTSKSVTPPFEDVEGELLGSAPSLDVWNMTGIRRGQADPGVTDVATSSSSGLDSSQHSRQEDDIESTMDHIFGGILRSDVVCGTCGYTSTAHDPFKDISVDIPEALKHVPTPPHVDTPKPNPVRRNSRANARGLNGKAGSKAGRGASNSGVKRAAEVLFHKEWETQTEASEPALSETSALPATTEASVRCSSVDDQSSVAGHVDSERDQTVSSPLHPSAAPQRSPTPEPPAIHQPHAFTSYRPASAAQAKPEVPFFSAKAAVQLQASPASVAAAEEAAKVAAADAKSTLVNAALIPSASEGDAPVVAEPKKDGQHASSAAATASSSGQQSSMKDFLQGQATQKGPVPGQRPSTAPASPAPPSGKIQKPSRCQKCHTCRHKQLKKQCLRNKALSSPTRKNIEEALRGGVEANVLTSILPAHLQPSEPSGLPGRNGESSAAASAPRLTQVLHSSKHRQAALLSSKPSDPVSQVQGSGKLSNQSQISQSQSQGSGRLQDASQGSGMAVQPASAVSSEPGNPDARSQDWAAVPAPPPPMPVKADPNSKVDATHEAVQQQLTQQQQQQQHAGVPEGLDLARQARDGFEQSVSQKETRRVEEGGGDGTAVLLQACLHRFVRPETLHRWVCSRCQCERTALKQMSIRQLPPVLCLHMKRFKATDKGATMKVDSRVVFPVGHLEMAPFTSAPVLAARCRLRGLLLAEPSKQKGAHATDTPHSNTSYRLHGVVCHTGNLLGGHYIGYVRCGEHWYQFDDARVTLVPEEYVRVSNAYMLFYLQQ
ncbi:hypothetical protein WJX77_002858 [Trebouxia sp. C0004]